MNIDTSLDRLKQQLGRHQKLKLTLMLALIAGQLVSPVTALAHCPEVRSGFLDGYYAGTMVLTAFAIPEIGRAIAPRNQMSFIRISCFAASTAGWVVGHRLLKEARNDDAYSWTCGSKGQIIRILPAVTIGVMTAVTGFLLTRKKEKATRSRSEGLFHPQVFVLTQEGRTLATMQWRF